MNFVRIETRAKVVTAACKTRQWCSTIFGAFRIPIPYLSF